MKWLCLFAFGGLGLIIFVIGLGWGYKRLELYTHGIQTRGTVVEIVVSTSSGSTGGSSTFYYPVVQFNTPDEKTYKFRGSTGNSAQDYFKDQSVELIYNPTNPSDAQITEFSQFWLSPLAITLFGFIFLVLGCGGFFALNDFDKNFVNLSSLNHRLRK